MRANLHTTLSIALIATFLAACDAEFVVPLPREYWPVWSPDGQRIAFICSGDGPLTTDALGRPEFSEDAFEICVMNSDGTDRHRLTYNQVGEQYPTCSPFGHFEAEVADYHGSRYPVRHPR